MYQAVQATISRLSTHTQTGIGEGDSARCGSNGSSAPNALTMKRTVP
ncbi:hypothetical protein SAMN05216338_105018 [Bradyrhizobium sp. Rc2d]|nr:hypothetical protein SAMN05216338_105018 [Bradyrhizobium sp. Rc2d]